MPSIRILVVFLQFMNSFGSAFRSSNSSFWQHLWQLAAKSWYDWARLFARELLQTPYAAYFYFSMPSCAPHVLSFRRSFLGVSFHSVHISNHSWCGSLFLCERFFAKQTGLYVPSFLARNVFRSSLPPWSLPIFATFDLLSSGNSFPGLWYKTLRLSQWKLSDSLQRCLCCFPVRHPSHGSFSSSESKPLAIFFSCITEMLPIFRFRCPSLLCHLSDSIGNVCSRVRHHIHDSANCASVGYFRHFPSFLFRS